MYCTKFALITLPTLLFPPFSSGLPMACGLWKVAQKHLWQLGWKRFPILIKAQVGSKLKNWNEPPNKYK